MVVLPVLYDGHESTPWTRLLLLWKICLLLMSLGYGWKGKWESHWRNLHCVPLSGVYEKYPKNPSHFMGISARISFVLRTASTISSVLQEPGQKQKPPQDSRALKGTYIRHRKRNRNASQMLTKYTFNIVGKLRGRADKMLGVPRRLMAVEHCKIAEMIEVQVLCKVTVLELALALN